MDRGGPSSARCQLSRTGDNYTHKKRNQMNLYEKYNLITESMDKYIPPVADNRSAGGQHGWHPDNQQSLSFKDTSVISWKSYFTDVYGELTGGWWMDLLLELWGPEYIQIWQENIHNKYFDWPGFTYYEGYGYAIILPPGCQYCTAYTAQFIDGYWQLSIHPA